jgi:hypothetical protein
MKQNPVHGARGGESREVDGASTFGLVQQARKGIEVRLLDAGRGGFGFGCGGVENAILEGRVDGDEGGGVKFEACGRGSGQSG